MSAPDHLSNPALRPCGSLSLAPASDTAAATFTSAILNKPDTEQPDLSSQLLYEVAESVISIFQAAF